MSKFQATTIAMIDHQFNQFKIKMNPNGTELSQ